MTVRILTGDCRDLLPTLPADSVHCVVTSPPYFGLRDYGTGAWEGGDPACDHRHQKGGEGPTSALQNASNRGAQTQGYREICAKCGARRVDRQIGLEPTPAEFVQAMVEVFREVRRVLRPDGTLWLNLGDSYASGGGSGEQGTRGQRFDRRHTQEALGNTRRPPGAKPKDLIGIPWRVAFALQDDGWYLRQDIIWAKPNPMPESVEDRCTKAHEYLFLLTKRPRYYFDAMAIAEKAVYAPGAIKEVERPKGYYGGKWAEASEGQRNDGAFKAIRPTRNRRSVWTIATAPYKEAHFATFPPALVEPCILAGTSAAGCCPVCGKPRERVVELLTADGRRAIKAGRFTKDADGHHLTGDNRIDHGVRASFNAGKEGVAARKTVGWRRCGCEPEPGGSAPCLVLDPFGGAGTVGLVAQRLGRDALLLELNPKYAAMAETRIKADATRKARKAKAAPKPDKRQGVLV